MGSRTSELTIFGTTLDVPSLFPPALARLADELRAQSESVRSGQRRRPRVMGLIPRAPESLTLQERFEELERLETGHETIFAHLREAERAFDSFFVALVDSVRGGIERQCARARELEEKRLEVMDQGLRCDDEALAEGARRSEQRLLDSARIVAQAVLLAIRQIDACRERVATLLEDQERRRRDLEQLVTRLRAHRTMLELEAEISRFRHQAATTDASALDVEASLAEAFAPALAVLDETARAAASVQRALGAVQTTARAVEEQRPVLGARLAHRDRELVEHLLTSTLERSQLGEALRRALDSSTDGPTQWDEDARGPGEEQPSVLTALRNIEALAEAGLGQPGADQSRLEIAEELRELERVVTSDGDAPRAAAPARPAVVDVPLEPGFIEVYPSTFLMGSPPAEVGRYKREVQHRVSLTTRLHMSATPVTQEAFLEAMEYNPSHFKDPARPVETVSWHEAAVYCNRLSEKVGLPRCYLESGTGPRVKCKVAPAFPSPSACPGYRLPTEAEWEYAARSGTSTATYAGDLRAEYLALSEGTNPVHDGIAWFFGNAGVSTHAVGSKRANAWGLVDMLGNVWEWCHDWFEPYPKDAVSDPSGPVRGTLKVIRGGSFRKLARCCRAAYRDGIDPRERADDLGFRVVRSVG